MQIDGGGGEHLRIDAEPDGKVLLVELVGGRRREGSKRDDLAHFRGLPSPGGSDRFQSEGPERTNGDENVPVAHDDGDFPFGGLVHEDGEKGDLVDLSVGYRGEE
jgi:hypothetical protein